MPDARKLFGNEKRKPFEEWTEAEQQAHAERWRKIAEPWKSSVVLPQQIAERLNEAIKSNLDSSSQWSERFADALASFRNIASDFLDRRPLLPEARQSYFPLIIPPPVVSEHRHITITVNIVNDESDT